MLPNRNLSAKSKIDKAIIGSQDWQAAKERSDEAAADRAIDKLWSETKSAKLRGLLDQSQEICFISMPSTSRDNVIPKKLALRLSNEFRAKCLIGDDHFIPVHLKAAKHIPRLQRPFHRRRFRPIEPDFLKKETEGKAFVVVDDILTTGGSAAVFCQALQDEGIRVESVIALMGDHRLTVDRNSVERLDAALKKSGLPFNGADLAARLTRVEAGGLIVTINSARSENAKQRLAGNLHGLLDQRPFADLGRAQEAQRDKSIGGTDRRNAPVAEGVQAWGVRDPEKERVGDPKSPGEKQLYQITVESKTTGRKYTESVTVAPEISKGTAQEFLSTKARELSAKVAAKHQIKNPGDLKITVKPIVPETEVSKIKGIDRSK